VAQPVRTLLEKQDRGDDVVQLLFDRFDDRIQNRRQRLAPGDHFEKARMAVPAVVLPFALGNVA
jgi:hypothetical protein